MFCDPCISVLEIHAISSKKCKGRGNVSSIKFLLSNHQNQIMFLCQTHCVFFLNILGNARITGQKKVTLSSDFS